MAGIVQRGIPESHDCIAHVLVDGAAVAGDHVGQRREQLIDEAGQRLRVHALGPAREAAHIGEQQRQLAALAAKLETGRICGEPLDERGGHVVTEGGADAPTLGLGQCVPNAGADHVDGGERQRGKHWVEE